VTACPLPHAMRKGGRFDRDAQIYVKIIFRDLENNISKCSRKKKIRMGWDGEKQ
jgi:hypothetical protein